MNSQKKAIANYSYLLSELGRYENKGSWTYSDIKQYIKKHNMQLCFSCPSKNAYIGCIGKKQFERMTQYCEQHPDIKYLIFDYPTRFADSKSTYKERLDNLKELGVKLVFIYNKDIPNFRLALDFILEKLKEVNNGQANRGDC